MTHYVAIVEEVGGKAIGVLFPDLPGCVSASDTLDEAMANASEALALWVDVAKEHGRTIPAPCKRQRDVVAFAQQWSNMEWLRARSRRLGFTSRPLRAI